MTAKERDILNRYIGEWSEYRKNDDEWKEQIIKLLEKQDSKIEKLHNIQEAEIKQIKVDISGDKGIKARLTKLETINKRALQVVGFIFTALGALFTFLKDFLIDKWNQLTN